MLRPRGVSRKAGTAAMRLGRRVGLSLALAVLLLPLRSANAAGGRDPLQVVDEFLTARSLNDVWGATGVVADVLKVRDPAGGLSSRALDGSLLSVGTITRQNLITTLVLFTFT